MIVGSLVGDSRFSTLPYVGEIPIHFSAFQWDFRGEGFCSSTSKLGNTVNPFDSWIQLLIKLPAAVSSDAIVKVRIHTSCIMWTPESPINRPVAVKSGAVVRSMLENNISARHLALWWRGRLSLTQRRFPPVAPVSSYIHYKSPNIVYWDNNYCPCWRPLSSQFNI
jgi:hypothetical protein